MPRDPFRRVDCLPSSRRVQVILDGEQVADLRRGFSCSRPAIRRATICRSRIRALDMFVAQPLHLALPL